MRTINQIKILSDILHNKELLVTIENIGKENVLFREGILYPGDRLKKFTCDCEQAETVDLFHLSKEKKYGYFCQSSRCFVELSKEQYTCVKFDARVLCEKLVDLFKCESVQSSGVDGLLKLGKTTIHDHIGRKKSRCFYFARSLYFEKEEILNALAKLNDDTIFLLIVGAKKMPELNIDD